MKGRVPLTPQEEVTTVGSHVRPPVRSGGAVVADTRRSKIGSHFGELRREISLRSILGSPL